MAVIGGGLVEQASLLQLRTSRAWPTQSVPPLAGGGLVQVLSLNWNPPPHGRLQSLKFPHGLQLPFTAGKATLVFA